MKAVAVKFQMAFDKRIIKVDVMGYKNISLQTGVHFFCDFLKPRSILNHFIIDSGKSLNIPWDVLIWIDKRFKLLNNILSVKNFNADLNDAVSCCIAAGGFNI